MEDTNEKSLFNNLWERRVPQFFVTYATVCFGIIQFLLFACKRYESLPDSLIDKFLAFAVLLTPAVLLYIYNHGKPGADPFTKSEKIFIPSNLALAGLVAFFVGGTSTAIAAPTAVEITTDEGEQITRYIPAISQTRQIALFPFEMTESDNKKENDWSELGIPFLLSKDLEQDMRFYTKSSRNLEYQIKSFGYEIDKKIPFSSKLKIANKAKVDYFMVGENLNQTDDTWSVDIKIYETGSGELFQEKTYSNSDIFSLIDECTIDISSSMFLAENNNSEEKIVDLPASDLVTSNLDALTLFFKGRKAKYYSDEYEKAAEFLKSASDLDPKSAEIKWNLAASINSLGDRESAQKLIGEALDLSKQLPERQQFAIKQSYWGMNDKTSNVLVLMNNWIKLYPQDFDPHKDLIDFYRVTYQLNKAKEIAAIAGENGHKDRVLAELVDLSIILEDFDDAEKYLEEYHAVYPELAKEDMRMGEIYNKKGDFLKALGFYQNLILDDPQNGKIYAKMAETNFANGQNEEALLNYNTALKLSDLAQDSTGIYINLLSFYVSKGTTSKFNETFDQLLDNMRTYMPETSVASTALQLCGMGALAGSEDHYKEYFESLYVKYPQMKPPFDCVSNFLFNLFKNDAEEFKKYNQGECKAMVFQGSPDLEYFVNGFLNSMEGNHDESISNFNTFIEKSGGAGKDFGYLLSKEYRLKGEPDKAIKYCQDFLKTSPHNGVFLFELSLAQLASGDKDEAIQSYKKIQKIWADAEPTFIYYDDYIQLAKDLSL